MKLVGLLTAAALAGGCYHDEAHTRTYVGVQEIHARGGHVVQVREVARAAQTTPMPGTPSGAMLGGIVFHRNGAAVIGGGFGLPQGALDRRAFEVVVSFDDGETGIFVYQDWSPYRPGDRVTLTPEGLVLR